MQLPGAPVEPILARLRANRSETLLVCGVHGGVLAEGVDYAGELAIGAFVVGPGLPKLDLERELVARTSSASRARASSTRISFRVSRARR